MDFVLGVIWILFTMGWFNKRNLVALSYTCFDDTLQPYVHKVHDMKLPLSFHETFRMKEFYEFKAEMYLGAVLRGASAQEATTQDIQPVRALPRWLLKENQQQSLTSSRTSLKRSLKVIPNKMRCRDLLRRRHLP